MKVITQQDFLVADIAGWLYTALAELLPPRFPYQQSKWDNDDRSLGVPNVSGSIWCRLYERRNNTQVAYAVFAADAEVVRCDDVNVDKNHRRKGIATFLYRLAAFHFRGAGRASQRSMSPTKKALPGLVDSLEKQWG